MVQNLVSQVAKNAKKNCVVFLASLATWRDTFFYYSIHDQNSSSPDSGSDRRPGHLQRAAESSCTDGYR
jgi:hypothetical protein